MNCYVLTGGLSRRMGSPKASLRLGESSFLDRIAIAATPVFDEVFELTRVEAAPFGTLPVVFEPPHDHPSPLYGILAALRHAGNAAWIIAADYPLVTSPVLRHLRARFDASDADLVMPVWEGKPQPLCAGYRASAAVPIGRRVASERFRIQDLLAELQVETVQESEIRERFGGEPLANINDPAEYERVRGAYGR